jgi:putative transposase
MIKCIELCRGCRQPMRRWRMRVRGRIESKVPVLVRFEARRANALWQVDHCRWHIWLVNERGRASKPWLTMVLDDSRRCRSGYRRERGGFSAEQTTLALRGAI